MPPDAARFAAYTTPTCPLGSDVVLIPRPGGRIAIESVTLFVCAGLPESVTWKVTDVPFIATVGVPLIAPLEAFKDNPAGSVPDVSDHICGGVPPVATSVAE